MLLPPLRSDEGKLFVRELLAHFRPSGVVAPGDYYPFDAEAVETLVDALARFPFQPRMIMEFLDIASGRLSLAYRLAITRHLTC